MSKSNIVVESHVTIFCLAALLACSSVLAAEKICVSPTNFYTVVVDPDASQTGYYRFKQCGDITNPTIGLEVGKTYIFEQEDRSNFKHPIGFAYYPDGSHANHDELQPGISLTGSDCVNDLSCPTPRYFKNFKYLGKDSVGNIGFDDYEPDFLQSSPEAFTDHYLVEIEFDDYHYDKDLFYFCHTHQYMSGRIKLIKDGMPFLLEDNPPLGYEYETSDYDRGTIVGIETGSAASGGGTSNNNASIRIAVGLGMVTATLATVEFLFL